MRAVDLFAGLGGFSEGATQAGCTVGWAANHWQAAVDTHAANHPETEHACQDLHQVDWARAGAHDILLASPCCQGHSKARGKASGNPQHDASRSTAWAVVSAVEFHRPEMGVVENVPEFLQWELFPAWRSALEAMGYALSLNVIDAADHGVPQHRERLFIALTKSKAPVQLDLPRRNYVPASSIIDMDAPRWSPIERQGRAVATLDRIRNGRARHGDRFLIPYYGSGSGLTGRSLDRPIGTITTLARWAVIDGDRMRMISVAEARCAMGFRENYRLPDNQRTAMHLLGNAVCPPVARDVITALKEAA